MADSPPAAFTVTEHVIDTQYIREFPNATISQDSPLKLVVKRYTPIDNPNPRPGDVTIIAAPGCGLPKELYEPLWEDILVQSKQQGFRIGSIWIADMANLGASGVVNEDLLGDDPSWFDHPRDILYMVNQFRHEMPRPIIGVGHSMGATQMALLSIMHPRLFTSLVLIEPSLTNSVLVSGMYALYALRRQDSWPSKSTAIKSAASMCQGWDSRVVERWNEHEYRSLPATIDPHTAVETESTDGPVTSTSSKYQEAMLLVRPNFKNHTSRALADSTKTPTYDPLAYPDIINPPDPSIPFYRSEGPIAMKMLKHIRPSVFYLYSEESPMATTEARTQILERTGAGIGGSGGVKHSQVKMAVLPDCGHMVPFEKTTETAALIGSWISQSVQRWQRDELRVRQKWSNQSATEALAAPAKWKPILEQVLRSEAQKNVSKF
ncbi:hypothetical protein PENCOP_c006G08443 [Penicillium coprophilum]|uniref:AB hydrolase-1 domain-containing protein n=1 Tax=Penicillium coprophilum TaxID=36646 RepID=A0A1V6UNG8_9EURO|nr:hypothetical protein PENCOP_c006G08443 [Penicillium coprophilum]